MVVKSVEERLVMSRLAVREDKEDVVDKKVT